MARREQESDAVGMGNVAAVRRLLSRHLIGSGVELGPGHNPFKLEFAGAQVQYVDRWLPDENRELFPELGDGAAFPKPDIVANLDVDRLKPLADKSQDFVIASHVLEHVANPLCILDEIHRVLRPGGTALVLLPDRRRTFDRGRQPTSLEHVVDHFNTEVTEVDDDHIVEFIRGAEGEESFARLETLPASEREVQIERHRQRSIHAHCWHEEEFVDVLLYGIGELGHEWDFVDGVLADDEGPDGMEFGYVLRRDPLGDLPPAERRLRFADAWAAWAAHRRASTTPPPWVATAKDLAVRAFHRFRR